MAIRSDDKIALIKSTGNDKPEYYTLDELNTFISAEESPAIATLQGQVGGYDPDVTESTITDDLEAAQTDILAHAVEIADLQLLIPEPGIPVVATYSTATTGSGEDYEILWTAESVGEDGNGIIIYLVDPETPETALSVGVEGNKITVTLGTGAGETGITSLASEVITAVNTDLSAGTLVQCTLIGGDAVIAAEVATTADAVDATLAVEGKIFVDSANSLLYICIADTDGTEEVLDNNWTTVTLTAIST